MVQKLRDLISVEFLEFDPSEYDNAHLALSGAHRMALTIAAKDAAYVVLLGPDLIFSDNTLVSVWRTATAGKTAVMVSGLRLTTETALPILRERRLSDGDGEGRILAARNLMQFSMRHFHPEVARYYFNSPNFTAWPLICLWPIDDEGVLDRSFHLHPLALDMAAARPDALSYLEHDTVDGAYVFHAFPERSKIYVEEDSDNMLVFSFSSVNECVEPMRERKASVVYLRHAAYLTNVNALHRSFFQHAIKLHTVDLNEKWRVAERATSTLSRSFRRSRRTYRLILAAKRVTGRLEEWQAFQKRGIRRAAWRNHMGAARDLAEAIRLGPPNPALHCLRGNALARARDRKAAKREFELALNLDPANATLRFLRDSQDWLGHQDRGIQRYRAGDYRGAADDFACAISEAPPTSALHFQHGLILLRCGDRTGGIAQLDIALALDPENPVIRHIRNSTGNLPSGFVLLMFLINVGWNNKSEIIAVLKALSRGHYPRVGLVKRAKEVRAVLILLAKKPGWPKKTAIR